MQEEKENDSSVDQRIQDAINDQKRRILLEFLKVLLVAGVIIFSGWGLSRMAVVSELFHVNPSLLAKDRSRAFDLSACAVRGDWALDSSSEKEDEGDTSFRVKWWNPSGIRVELQSIHKRRPDPAVENLGKDSILSILRHRARAAVESIQSAAPRNEPSFRNPAVAASDSVVVHEFDWRVGAVETHHKDGSTTVRLESGWYVAILSTSKNIDFLDAIQLLEYSGFVHDSFGVGTLRGWVRLHEFPMLPIFVLACCVLWMWQVVSSPSRFAGIPSFSPSSSRDEVETGLRTLVGLTPRMNVEERSPGRWSIRIETSGEGLYLDSPQVLRQVLEFRLSLGTDSVGVREVERTESQRRTLFSWFRQSEISFSIPMMSLPSEQPWIMASKQGFSRNTDIIYEGDLRYALARYFLLHGWSWKPQLL